MDLTPDQIWLLRQVRDKAVPCTDSHLNTLLRPLIWHGYVRLNKQLYQYQLTRKGTMEIGPTC